MTNSQLYFAIGIPSVLVLISWASNWVQLRIMSHRIGRVEDDLRVLGNDLKQFYRDLGNHDGRLAAIEARAK